ncbi:cob(I)yrinic acid a,c-diamide adenosyltransferase [Patescibacteria group bacterium]|nr:cob(I)yrinic acid a,c-diamide adenosyltransferase [Patescibacteria group bacterium]MBU1028917.1 cob(I)yrinic acid a,c-diamide adenosyltransferase [Patescibacteria group bacterium]MBU1916146.1 cob(I)yrinic acid a,c-diamide adenosyltransferase [Patescibacteria group bacterium]
MNQGYIQIYTGDGKGKTTAALGLAVRAVGAGKRVAIVYFDKGGTHYSERKVLAEKFSGEIDFYATGQDRIDPDTGHFRFGVEPEDKVEAERGFALAKKIIQQGKHDLVILDEINTTGSLGLLEAKLVEDLLRNKPAQLELVLTGRGALQSWCDLADLITDMQPINHYFYRGAPARIGLDY